MKKIIVLLSFIGLFSCSNDNEIRNEDTTETNITNSVKSNSNINDDIDRMFYEYVNSTEYREFNFALSSFYDKLNIDNREIDFEIKENSIMDWVELNLHSTDFVSLDSASTEWQQVVNLKDVELKKFPQVTDFIVKNSEQKVLPYIAKWLNPYQSSTNNVDCEEQFDDCNTWADQQFFNNIFKNSHQLSPTMVSTINLEYTFHLEICMYKFNECLGI